MPYLFFSYFIISYSWMIIHESKILYENYKIDGYLRFSIGSATAFLFSFLLFGWLAPFVYAEGLINWLSRIWNKQFVIKRKKVD